MLLGAHLSIGKGWLQVAATAAMLGCEAVQVFSRSPRGGPARPLVREEVVRFRQEMLERGPLFVHTPYILNLAAEAEEKRYAAVRLLAEDWRRAAVLGAVALVTHVGHAGGDRAAGLERVVQSLREAWEMSGEARQLPVLLLENTAGQGNELGSTLQELGWLLRALRGGPAVGICLDTCHAFAAGYELRTEEGWDAFLSEVRRHVGLEAVRLIHLNDSRAGLGSRRDRHQEIGLGALGPAAFWYLLRRPEFSGLPAVIETPKKDVRDDARNLRRLRWLLTLPEPPRELTV